MLINLSFQNSRRLGYILTYIKEYLRPALMKLGVVVLLSLSADLFCLCHESSPIGN